MTWQMTPVPTEIELRFKALGPALTRVEVEHRGWEALSDEQVAAECALPGGGYARRFLRPRLGDDPPDASRRRAS